MFRIHFFEELDSGELTAAGRARGMCSMFLKLDWDEESVPAEDPG